MTTEIIWSKEQVQELVRGCKEQWGKFEKSINAIIKLKLWEKLDYASFEEMFVGEGFDKFKLSPSVRRNALDALKKENPELSNRHAAEILGANEKTVRNDQKVRNSPHPLKDDKSESNGIKPLAIEGEIVLSMPDRLARDWKQFDQTLTDAIRANVSWRQVAGILGLTEEEALRRYQIK